MTIFYDEKLQMWEGKERLENGEHLKICITQWANTEKGPLIDFAIFIGDKETFFEIELLTKKTLKADEIPKYCSIIISEYLDRGENFLNSKLISKFPFNIDAYCRQGMGGNCKLLKYLGKRYPLFRKASYFCYEAGEETWRRPALEYPGSRLDCICD